MGTQIGSSYYPFSKKQGYSPSTCAQACTATNKSKDNKDNKRDNTATATTSKTCVSKSLEPVTFALFLFLSLTICRHSLTHTYFPRTELLRASTAYSTPKPIPRRTPPTTAAPAVAIVSPFRSRTAMRWSPRQTQSQTRDFVARAIWLCMSGVSLSIAEVTS